MNYEEVAKSDGWVHVGTEKDGTMLFSMGTSITGADIVRLRTWRELCELYELFGEAYSIN